MSYHCETCGMVTPMLEASWEVIDESTDPAVCICGSCKQKSEQPENQDPKTPVK